MYNIYKFKSELGKLTWTTAHKTSRGHLLRYQFLLPCALG